LATHEAIPTEGDVKEVTLLAGDIGGTKTTLGIFSSQSGPRQPLAEATFASADYASLEVLASEFLGKAGLTVTRASFGVAGPVVGGRADVTNLPWIVDERALAETLGLGRARLLNDLDAIAHAVPVLDESDLHTVHQGHPDRRGPIAIVAPGTGLGEAFLTWDGSRYKAHPSEGGHADFAPRDELQIGLLRYLLRDLERVSYERVCSGRGLPNIYRYLKETGHAEEPPWLRQELAAAEDPTPVIANAALDMKPPCPLCVATLETFVSILGAEAGNLALKVVATGGVYLGGGIPPRILPILEKGYFLEAFRAKGRLSDLIAPIPIHVILNPRTALLGAAQHGLEKNHV
jgi:glucokinase